MQPSSWNEPRLLHASRIATTSACAVGSYVEVTRLTPSPTILPSRAITQPNGPPFESTPFCASSIARRMNCSSISDIYLFGFYLDLKKPPPKFTGNEKFVCSFVVCDAVQNIGFVIL